MLCKCCRLIHTARRVLCVTSLNSYKTSRENTFPSFIIKLAARKPAQVNGYVTAHHYFMYLFVTPQQHNTVLI